MDRIDAMRAFVRVMERRSFAMAAHDLALPRSRISEAVRQLEERLGVKLLVRTTRRVTPTTEGEEYHRRCVPILAAVDEAQAAVASKAPAGRLRVDLHGTLARRFLLPHLPEFLARHPGVELHIGEGDRLVNLVEEGVDCVVRVGEPADSGLIGRRLGLLDEGTFASPAYLDRHGTPTSPEELDGHRMIGFASSSTRAVIPLEFQRGVDLITATPPISVTVTAAATYAQLARLGLGIIQVPRYRVARYLENGELVEVLRDFPPRASPVYLLYPDGRQLSPQVRAFMDWVQDSLEQELGRP